MNDNLQKQFYTGCPAETAQQEQDFGLGLLAHKVMHPLDDTDFWRNALFPSIRLPSSGSITFGAHRAPTFIKLGLAIPPKRANFELVL